MSQSIREFMGIGAQGIGASQPAQRPGLRETFKEFFKKDNLKKAMRSPIAMTGKEYFANPKTATQGLQMAQKLQAGKYPTSAAAQQLLAGKPVTGLGGLQAQMMYHGTKPTNIPNIMSEGFKAKPAAGGFSIQAADLKMSGPKTFATPVKPMAAMYGKPINVVMPAMANKLPSGAVALSKIPGAIGAAATVGPAAFDLTTALLENTPLGGMVESAGASLANTQIGQQLAGALGVPQTPNLQQGIATTSVANPVDPGVPLDFGTTHGHLFDKQGNIFKASGPDSFYRALASGYGSYGPRDFYESSGYLNNPLVMGPPGQGFVTLNP